MQIRSIIKGAVLSAAIALPLGLAAPAFASGGPSTNVPVSAELGTSIGFASLPTAVDFGQATLGGTTVVSSPVSIAGNTTTYNLTVAMSAGGMSDGKGDTISNTNLYWFPASVNGMTGGSQGAWQDLNGDTNTYGNDPAGPATQSSGGGQQIVGNNGTMGPTGTGTVNAEWGLRLPISQPAGSYSETATYSLSGS